ncbi:elongation factor P maturation arginine rhamnosyltransferase EarP [Undibacterium baiyunense]|uniref:Protein-arginine rhamnosyltransferase n=1 Tax=Undibacterium baiyunense TaxID=2828731 RepID=A0A941DD84_9BURK|nr:elongation factor P maturation arginine rhamnosyltransferase EarP [Undibacterium baiyunense]MBR7746579.1 elongation factor P maturation arginine rhamnosyltransferase EarP [Undibacterium baiyunense]
MNLALFCKVVDNFGDIGICWRLVRQLRNEHAIEVTLWVDDLASFKKICPEVCIESEHQTVQHIQIQHWQRQDQQFEVADIADIVIEFFGCDIPPNYIATMAKCQPQPIWINLEGLTAEDWVEGCHTLPSSHPQYPLTKYFFFPGFNKKTGGLILEKDLLEQAQQFNLEKQEKNAFLHNLGLSDQDVKSFKISMFCYPHAPLMDLLKTWEHSIEKISCLIPTGVAQDKIAGFLQCEPLSGSKYQKGNLSLHIIPFLPQAEYDKLLWSCDLNFVRGEDSFVRAQWAGKAFIWHIYPQDENLHHKKLKAFLNVHDAESQASKLFSLAWNGVSQAPNWPELWSNFRADLNSIQQLSLDWQQQMRNLGDMSSNLLSFIKAKQELDKKIG